MFKYVIYILVLTIGGCLNPKPKSELSHEPNMDSTGQMQENNPNLDSLLISLVDQNEVEDEKVAIDSKLLQNKIAADTLGSCEKCNLNYVLLVDQNIDNLEYEQVYNFLCTIRYSCVDDAEFGEYSNEILFLLLEKQPRLAVNVMKSNSDINLKLIYKELSSPIHDGINVNLINSIIERELEDGAIKKEIVKSLQVAIDRYN